MTRRIELLAPARTAEIGREAILHGADAVYIGGPAFGARDKAGNSMQDIAALVEFAHRFHARIHVTLNTILHDDELELARQLAQQCWDAGVDALIVQDMGLLELDLPPIDLHASTQCDIRTPEKARFLADAGFSQIVLARELTIPEIAAVRAAVPADVVIEHFVHGALCVAYSGQCSISHAQTGRSANRGDCSQACRLPYTLQDMRGQVVAFQKHVLSLKDNNQSANLRSLIDAGVGSFKIEGRYKDAPYVKNVVGHYRRLLDRLGEPATASGRTKLFFTPDPDKTFHRGSTDYFSRGRQADIGAFDTPAFVGTPLGTIAKVGTDFIDIETAQTMANGDGLAWLNKREATGMQANTVERIGENLWRVHPDKPIKDLPGLKVATNDGYSLTLADSDGIAATARIACESQSSRNAEKAEMTIREQLGRLGNTDFDLAKLVVEWPEPRFVPNSLLNQLRRDAVAALVEARRAGYRRPLRRPAIEPPTPYPEATLSFLANVYNAAARRFYEKHGVRLIAAAYEAHEETGEVPLMITRHCLRYSFSLCPKQAKGVAGVQGQLRAEPMVLVNGNDKLRLEFDCRACEMHVVGRIKQHILAAR